MALAGQMESPYFPLPLDQMPGNIEIEELKKMEFRIGNIPIESCFTNHPGVCVGYRFHTTGGVIVYMPDNETMTPRTTDRSEQVPTGMDGEIADFIREADVLIMDAQYDAKEYANHIGWDRGGKDKGASHSR